MRGLPGRTTVTVQPAKAKDNRGAPTGSEPASYTVRQCDFAPHESEVDHDRATTVVQIGKLYAPGGAVFPDHATVTLPNGWAGLVEGRTQQWGHAGRVGQVVTLRRVTG